MTSHIMIDLETMGVTPDASIVSIGAVVFDPKGEEVPSAEIDDTPYGRGECFYTAVDLESNIKVGRQVDASTEKWWSQQSEEARRTTFPEDPEKRKDLVFALTAFTRWIRSHPYPYKVWSHGSGFDITMLESAFRSTHGSPPWKFWDARDTRTVFDMAFGGGSSKDLPSIDTPEEFIAHHAWWDAWIQARQVQKAYQKLGLSNG